MVRAMASPSIAGSGPASSGSCSTALILLDSVSDTMTQSKAAPREAKATDVIRDMLPLAGKRVLDVGCGDGGLTRAMARAGDITTGVDISETRLAEARAKEAVPGADYREGRGEKLPFADASVDA